MTQESDFLCGILTLVLREHTSSATEPIPRDEVVRGWRMARPVHVARRVAKKMVYKLQIHNS